MIRGRVELRSAYSDDAVARSYVEDRFVQPIGALLHSRQSAALRRMIRGVRPRRILEIAPGPARLTVETRSAFEGTGVMLDASAQMLAEAVRRIGDGFWRPVQGDVFSLPFRGEFDLAYTFRLIRHFERPDRLLIYHQLAHVLRSGGYLMFDAVNRAVSERLRRTAATNEYEHFDALLTLDDIRAELVEAGFSIENVEGVQHRFPTMGRVQVLIAPRSKWFARGLLECLDRCGGEPLEWIVTCRRR